MSIVLNYSIKIKEKEDYVQIGNSRIGGKPDLPIAMDYPVFENKFYEFILQLNLNDLEIEGLPNNGLLSIFYGNLDKNEAIAYCFNDNIKLELKEIPIDIEFAGVADFREHNSYKFEITEKVISPRESLSEYNDPQFEELDNIMHWKSDFLNENSFLMHSGLQDKSHIYLKANGFEKLCYGYGIWINSENNKINYRGRNANRTYLNANELLNCEVTKEHWKNNLQEYLLWKEQLETFEDKKEYHLDLFKDYKCILSLASRSQTGMIWGDLHKLEFYGLATKFLTNNVIVLNSTIP